MTDYFINTRESMYNYTEIAKLMSILLKDVPQLYTEREGILKITFKGERFFDIESLAGVLGVSEIEYYDSDVRDI